MDYVYVVTRGAYEDYHIVAVFSTRSAAERYRDMNKDPETRFDPWWVDKLPLHKSAIEAEDS